MISLASAKIPFNAYLNVFDCLWSERIGRGKYVDRFEKLAAEYFGVKHCIAVSSGTLADVILLSTLKELHPGKDEVILPAFTFIAQANAVLWAGLKPVFVDVNDDMQISSEAPYHLKEKTLCVFPVHLIGKSAISHMFKFTKTVVPIVEDCCEAMGGVENGIKFGTIGLAGAFSMYPSHTITTGEGGLIITNDDEFHKIARSIHNHGKWGGADFNFKYLGTNAKMTNLQAAIGCELIKTIDDVNVKRRHNVSLYNSLLDKNFYASAPHCYPVFYDSQKDRDDALKVLADYGIECRKLMGCVPDSEPYVVRFGIPRPDQYVNARRLANTGLFVPIHQNLTKKQIEYICDVIRITPFK